MIRWITYYGIKHKSRVILDLRNPMQATIYKCAHDQGRNHICYAYAYAIATLWMKLYSFINIIIKRNDDIFDEYHVLFAIIVMLYNKYGT